MNINDTEIERKWILPDLPDTNLPLIKHHFVKQAYFAVTPDIECRLTCRITDATFKAMMPEIINPKLTIKVGDSALVRAEYELPLSPAQFFKAQRWVKKPYIVKEVWCYEQPDEFKGFDHIVVSHVDDGFWYCEVEFDSRADAEHYTLPAYFKGNEVTGDPKYSMKNYWLETRGT